MVVFILERVPVAVRGRLTRWLLEPRAGTFVGDLPAGVRDLLWIRVCRAAGDGAATLIYSTNNEQGFAVRTSGHGRREIVNFEGIDLVRWPAD